MPSPIEDLLRRATNPNPPADTVCSLTPENPTLAQAICSCNSCGVHQVGPSQPGVCDCCARKGHTAFTGLGLNVTMKEDQEGRDTS